MQKGIAQPSVRQQLAPELCRRFLRTRTVELSRDVGNNLIAGHGRSSRVVRVCGFDVPPSCQTKTLFCTRSRGALRFLVDDGDESRNGIAKAGRRGGESWCAVCVCPVRFPISPLLVQVLFPDPCAPLAGFLVECGADFEAAVPCGIIRGVTDAEEDVPVWGMPDL